MKNFFIFLNITLVSSILFAGTPPVTKLKVLTESTIELTEEGVVPDTVICAYGDKEQPVIPSKWYSEPSLPEGLFLEQGSGADNCKLYLKGKPQKEIPLTRYKIYALNNGNKVQNNANPCVDIDIIIYKKQDILRLSYSKLEELSLPNISFKNIPFPFSIQGSGDVVFAHDKMGFMSNFDFVVFNRKTFEGKKVPLPSPFPSTHVLFDGENFVCISWDLSGAIGHKIFKIDPISEEIVATFEMPGKANEIETLSFVFFVDNHYIFLKNKDLNSILVTNSKFEKVTEENIGSINRIGTNKTSIFFVNNNENKIKIFFPATQTMEEIDIKHFDLNMESGRIESILFINGSFLLSALDPIYQEYFILKVSNNKVVPFRIGEDPLVDLVYGNGFLGVITNYQFMLFDWETRKKIHEDNLASGLTDLTFTANSFIIKSFGQLHIFNPATNRTTTIPDEYNLEILLPETDQKLIAFSNDDTLLLDTDFLSIQEVTIPGKCIAITEDYIATSMKNELCLYSKSTKNLIKKISLPQNIDKVVYDSTSKNFAIMCDDPQKIFLINLLDFKRNEINTNENILTLSVKDNQLFILTTNKIEIFELQENKTHSISLTAPIESLYSLEIQHEGKKMLVTYSTDVNEDICIVINKVSHKIEFETQESYLDARLVTENSISLLKRDTVFFVNLDHPEPALGIGTLGGYNKIISGNGRIVVCSQSIVEIFYEKDNVTQIETITENFNFASYNKAFFADNKFFIEQTNGTFVVIDGIHNKLLGSFKIPIQIESIVK